MAAHTPGPWAVYLPEHDVTARDEDADRTITVALMSSDESEEICEANARLIAAAPDLLEAAIDLVQQVAAYDRLHGKDSCAIDPDALRAAIAAATGEEEEHDTEQDFSDADLMIPQEEN